MRKRTTGRNLIPEKYKGIHCEDQLVENLCFPERMQKTGCRQKKGKIAYLHVREYCSERKKA